MDREEQYNVVADVQMQADDRELPIDQVGVKNLRYPIKIKEKGGGWQRTVSAVDMSVRLPQQFKGTHMSRFISILNEFRGRIEIRAIGQVLEAMKEKLQADSVNIEMKFPYFIEKRAPVTGVSGMMDYDCWYTGSLDQDDELRLSFGVHVPVTTVCPCSKEISDRGAHNQRCRVRVDLESHKLFWIEDLIALIESCGSCELFAQLKRPDEKWITEHAYDKPRFVEDIVREVAKNLRDDPSVSYCRVEAESAESIHNHEAYAIIEIDRRER